MANMAQPGLSDAPAGRAKTLGELKESGYRSRSVKEELRHNLIKKLQTDEPKFEGIVGFEETVVPQVENAIFSGEDIIFPGERGHAKPRLARNLPGPLAEWLQSVWGLPPYTALLPLRRTKCATLPSGRAHKPTTARSARHRSWLLPRRVW